ncbi:molecular chaperone DjiA [Kordiimonas sp. SCSIO 12610]|uniref:molecular chaperone DjiA n=1 Tax=Kordiimonas sp. SCSIO 12610 TaxID=2829597 RepID=UPI0021089013|nr:molecular chaperone DjiA [Kordiimonas sp. SCSIO 12610]UTW56389.1 molecular chaperone DjiA [Kordiimonas sp. SCSIO 12610]
MSVWGKIIGTTAGIALGGPLGALLGLTLGAAVDAGIEKTVEDDSTGTRNITFTIGVIALAAKMAKADGRVTRDEVDAFKAIFRVPAEEMKNVGRVFDMARQHTAGFEAYARQVEKTMRGNKGVLTDLLDSLFYIAKADGHVHPKELEYIEVVAGIFGLTGIEIRSLLDRHVGPDPDSPYTILGVSADISDEDLKKRYRQLVRETHPDRMIAEGVPSDFIAVATRRAAEINTAYDKIMAERSKS